MDSKNTLLDDISAEIGFTATVALAAWFGGKRMYVPEKFDEQHIVAKVIGARAYERFVSAFGPDLVFIPKGAHHERHDRWKKVYDRLLLGQPMQQIVDEVGISSQHIHNIRRDLENRGILPVILHTPPTEC